MDIKKLRELILTLAMQGKLVKQDPKDQPASELLKEIQAEKDRLIKEGKSKKQKDLPPIKPEEVSYAVPEGWEWVRLGEIGIINPRNEVEDSLITGFVPMPLISEGMANLHTFAERPWSEIKKGYTHFADGDVGMAKITPCFENAKSCVFKGLPNGIGAGTTELHIFRNTFNSVVPVFLLFYLKNPKFLAFAESKMTGSAGQKRVPTPLFTELLIPLPPIAEQKRIVAKIDQLMALCDKLEAQRNARSDKRLAVHTAAINRLLTAADKNDFDAAWQFITRHFDPLYSVKENVAELKKAILTLAMQGKLVKQDPKDQPASELLKEIQAEKKNLASREGANARRKEKELPPIKPEEVPYQVPKGWVWVRLGEVGETNIGLTYSPTNISEKGIPVLRSSNVQNGRLDFNDIVRVQMDVKESALVKEGDLLICARNGSKALVGKTAMITGLNEPMAFGAFMAIFRSRINKYILRFINSPLFRRMIDEVNTMTINQITQENLKNTAFPLPPLAEQKRIVAKIDELMALCDRLESQIDQATAKQTALFDAVLAQV
jgi:type I restriction enzyme S subunit